MALSIEELVLLSLKDRHYTRLLWKRLEPLCLKWASKLQNVDYSFEDLYQESYLILVQTLESYNLEQTLKFESYFKLLLYRWGWNYTHKKRALPIESDVDFWGMLKDDQQLEADYLYKEDLKILQEGLKSLSKLEYNLIIDLYIKGLKISQIATLYEIDYKMLESKKRRTLKKLQKFFDAF